MKRLRLTLPKPVRKLHAEEHASRVELFKTDRNVLKQVGSLDIIEHILKLTNMSKEAKVRLIETALSGFITGKEQSKGATQDTPSGKPSITKTIIEDGPDLEVAPLRRRQKRAAPSMKKKSAKRKAVEWPTEQFSDSESIYEDANEFQQIYPDLTSTKKAAKHENDAVEMGEKLLQAAGITWNKNGNIIINKKTIPNSSVRVIVPLLFEAPGNEVAPAGYKDVLQKLEKGFDMLLKETEPGDAERFNNISGELKSVREKLTNLTKMGHGTASLPNKWKPLRR